MKSRLFKATYITAITTFIINCIILSILPSVSPKDNRDVRELCEYFIDSGEDANRGALNSNFAKGVYVLKGGMISAALF